MAKRKHNGARPRTQRPGTQPQCGLPPDADRPEHHEWLSCISVGILGYGTSAIAMGANDVVAVRDVWLTAGVKETFKVAAANAGQDAELFVLRSDAAASTWIRSRGSAAAAAAGNGPARSSRSVTPCRRAGGTSLCSSTRAVPARTAWPGRRA